MIRRLLPFATALCGAVFVLSSHPVFAQTKPSVKVPAEEPSQARAVVRQLLKEGRIIRASDVQRGMRGVARSVFQGTKIEEFPIEILGVLTRVNGGGDIVLIKVLGGPVVQRQSGIIAGMSGSPVYINGKMLGAIALGWGFPKEPIGGVTPITQMIEGALPDNARRTVEPNTKPASDKTQVPGPTPVSMVYRPRQPLQVAGHSIRRMVVSRDRRRLALSGTPEAATMTMRPVSTLLQLSGFSEATLPYLKSVLEPYGIEPVIGLASRKTGVKAPFEPGAALGVQLVSGDMDQTAVGTVTFRWGNRVLAFGHPMFGQGAASLPMTSAYVHEIFPSYQRSFKMASPIATVGALQQDTQFAIGGTVGVTADMIPMQINLRDPERHIARTYRVRIMKDPVLTPQLVLVVAADAIESALGETSDKMVRIGLRLDIDNAPSVVRRNYIYANSVVTMAALGDMAQSLSITQMNEFAKGSIRRVNLDVALEPVRRTARIKQVVANRNKIKAGETVQVNVVLEPTDAPDRTMTHTFSFTVPADAPNGVMRIAAGRGADYWPLQARAGGPLPQPTNLRELVEAWGQVGSFNELVVEASTPNTFLKVDRQKISGPAPSWARLLRGPGVTSTSIATFNEVDARRVQTGYALTGSQFLTIPVESQRHRDKNAPAGAATTLPAEGADTGASTPEKTPEPGGPPNSGGDLPDLPDDPDNAYYTGGASAGRLDLARLYQGAPFLAQLKAWRRLANPQADPKEPPARDKPDKPIVPALTSPTATPTPTSSPAPGVTPTATPSPTPLTGKIIGRPAQSWVQANPADFLSGDFERTFVTVEGIVRLAPPSRLLATTAEPFVWSIAADNKSNIYLGTGHNARILKIDADGKQTVFYDGGEVAVTALATDAAGNLYAGLTPGGKLYRFAPDGTHTVIFDAAQSFVWALEWDAAGRLLVATGGGEGNSNGGHLYRLSDAATRPAMGTPTPEALKALEVARVPQNHIRCLAVQGDDIYVGAGDEGVLYRINGATGAVAALYQVQPAGKTAQPTEVLAVAIAPEGVYFGTSINGTVYRWDKENGVIALYASPQQTVYALRRAPDGKLYAATGETGVVYQISPGHDANDTNAARLLEPTQLQALALGLTPGGDLLVGTGNNGAAFQVALRDTVSGTFTSNVFDAKNVVRWGALRMVGRGTLIETRSGNTLEPDASWSDWAPAIPNEVGELQVAAPPARYLQYRARLFDKDAAPPNVSPASITPVNATLTNATSASGGAPGLARLEVLYRAKNSPPSVSFSAPQGGEFWNAKKKLTWTAKDPDSDTLRYRLWLSDDDGKTWQPLPITDNDASSFELDTSKWRDGVYRFKVEASDAVRNPEDPLRDSATSLPVTIDNTAPRIANVSLNATPDGMRLQANVSDDLSPITGVEWRIVDAKPETKADAKPDAKTETKPEAKADTKSEPKSETKPSSGTPSTPAKDAKKDETDDWHAAAAVDGIFDSKREAITTLATPPTGAAPAGGRKLELRAHDAAGNSATTTVPWP